MAKTTLNKVASKPKPKPTKQELLKWAVLLYSIYDTHKAKQKNKKSQETWLFKHKNIGGAQRRIITPNRNRGTGMAALFWDKLRSVQE
jgi:hypothetical protein